MIVCSTILLHASCDLFIACFRPNDSRMLIALGEVYERVGKAHLAKKCYWRAVVVGDTEDLALPQIAKSGLFCHCLSVPSTQTDRQTGRQTDRSIYYIYAYKVV
jgi:hypothetical protein